MYPGEDEGAEVEIIDYLAVAITLNVISSRNSRLFWVSPQFTGRMGPFLVTQIISQSSHQIYVAPYLGAQRPFAIPDWKWWSREATGAYLCPCRKGNFCSAGIHRLILRYHISGEEQIYAVYMTPVMAISNMGADFVRSHSKRLARFSLRLDVDAQGRDYTLVGGLDETTAYGLMSDVERALKGEAQPVAASPSSPITFCAKCGAA